MGAGQVYCYLDRFYANLVLHIEKLVYHRDSGASSGRDGLTSVLAVVWSDGGMDCEWYTNAQEFLKTKNEVNKRDNVTLGRLARVGFS